MKMRNSALYVGVAALVLSAGALASRPSEAHADPAATGPAVYAEPHVVTLVTGDRVLVQPGGGMVFEPGEGREDVGYTQASRLADGVVETFVIPRDAASLVAQGKLDRRLFNVTALAREGLGTGRELPLIVKYAGGASRTAGRSFAASGDVDALRVLGAEAMEVSTEDIGEFWREVGSGAARIWLDGTAEVVLDVSVPQVGAPEVWGAGHTGEGITAAVLDTGYDPTHPDLAGRVAEAKDFTDTSPEAVDGFGHGTHVASTVAGTGAASDGRYKGVAPGAKLLIGKVCDDEGYCTDSDIIEGMQWAVGEGAEVVNLSIGGDATDGTDPLSQAVNELSADGGTLFVVAAGNEGTAETIGAPGAADAALTVGSVTKQDGLSDFSSQGPRVGDHAVKPDISAPGSGITAARAEGTTMGEPAEDGYITADGTSMATPHVTGAVALLKQAHPEWKGPQLKIALMNAAEGLDGLTSFQQGSGRLDVARAVSQSVTTDAGSLSFGRFAFPHGQKPVTRTLTYRNAGASDIVLSLAFQVSGPGAATVPDGLFTVDKPTLTVPAGGTASVTVTVDPSRNALTGAIGGALVATAGDVVVRTAVGADLEPERYNLTLKAKPRTGGTLGEPNAAWFNVDTGESGWIEEWSDAGTTTLRVAPGRYEFIGSVETLGKAPSSTAFVSDVTVSGKNRTVTWDANKGKKLGVKVDKGDAKHSSTVIGMRAIVGEIGYSLNSVLPPKGTAYVVPTGKVWSDYVYSRYVRLSSPSAAKKAYRYNLYFTSAGSVPKGGTSVVADSALRKENTVYESQGVAVTATRADVPRAETYPFETAVTSDKQAVPGKRTEYFTASTEWEWASELNMGTYMDEWEVTWTESKRTPGTKTVHWGQAPLGPNTAAAGPNLGAWRQGDEVGFQMTMFSGPKSSMPTWSNTSYVTGTGKIYLDGSLISAGDYGCSGSGELPAGASGKVTITCNETRKVPWSKIGTKSSGSWTVATVAADAGAILPLHSVRVSSPNVVNGFAKVGERQSVTLDVGRPEGAPAPGTKNLKFEVSYDGGKTWKKVTISRVGDHATASLKHPKGATGVSVRVSGTDRAGNTFTQTTVKAWGLG